MDGTLLDSSRTVPAAYIAAIQELFGRTCTAEEVVAGYSAGPAGSLLALFIGRSSTDADVECWHRHLESRLHLSSVYDGVAEALDTLRTAGLKLGVFTGATLRAARTQLEHAGLGDFFEVVVASDEIEHVKPAPDGLLLACARLGTSARTMAYVGDARNDLRCARAVHALPVAAAWGHLFERDDEAHLVANTPQELVSLLSAGGV
jgi:HAD superfamily hydrolase (TIGR01549 family)